MVKVSRNKPFIIARNSNNTVVSIGAELNNVSRLSDIIDDRFDSTGESAFVANRAGGSTSIVNGTYTVVDCAIVVAPPSTRYQTVSFECYLATSGTGGAWLYANLYDIISSTSVSVQSDHLRIDADLPTSTLGPKLRGTYRVPPHNDYKPFSLNMYLSKDAGENTRVLSVHHPNASYGTQMRVITE